MSFNSKPLFCSAVAAFLLGTAVCSAGQDGPSALLNRMREADPAETGDIIARVAELGEGAVPALSETVAEWKEIDDTGFVVSCLLALSQIGPAAQPATETIADTLNSSHPGIQYAASRALRSIWDDAEPDDEDLRSINASLLASLYRSNGPRLYGPALALIQINRISVDMGDYTGTDPSSLPPRELRGQLERWAADNPNRFPPVAEQPWELLLARLLRQPGSATSQRAKTVLIERQSLVAVDPLLRVLPRASDQPERWAALAELLSEITGVSLNTDAPENQQAATDRVQDWRNRWSQALKERKDSKHRAYTWQRLETMLAEMQREPTEELRRQIHRLHAVILQQFDSPENIPPTATEMARQYVRGPLAMKQRFAEALQSFREAEQTEQKLSNIKKMRDLIATQRGREVGRQFLPQLLVPARNEQSPRVLEPLGRLLTTLTEVPIHFGQPTMEKRKQAIEQWLLDVQQREEE